MGEKLESLGSPADYSVIVIPSEGERKAGRKVGWKQRMQHSSKEMGAGGCEKVSSMLVYDECEEDEKFPLQKFAKLFTRNVFFSTMCPINLMLENFPYKMNAFSCPNILS